MQNKKILEVRNFMGHNVRQAYNYRIIAKNKKIHTKFSNNIHVIAFCYSTYLMPIGMCFVF